MLTAAKIVIAMERPSQNSAIRVSMRLTPVFTAGPRTDNGWHLICDTCTHRLALAAARRRAVVRRSRRVLHALPHATEIDRLVRVDADQGTNIQRAKPCRLCELSKQLLVGPTFVHMTRVAFTAEEALRRSSRRGFAIHLNKAATKIS